MQRYCLLLGLVFGVLLVSCNNDTVEPIVNTDNTAPPDVQYSDLEVKNYVNRCYIVAFGRKASDSEADSHVGALQSGNMTTAARETFLDGILNSAEHSKLLYGRAVADMLNNADSVAIQQQIDGFESLLSQTQYAPFKPEIQLELDRMNALQSADEDFVAGSITYKTLEKRIILNRLYDDINMGTLNFVVSVFEHLLDRQPTESELERGIAMCDGQQAVIFLEDGASKNDFMDILHASTDYHAETTKRQFQRLLFRDPTAEELTALSQAFANSGDFRKLERSIMATTEFVNR